MCQFPLFTALPVRVTHLQVAASTGWVLSGTLGTADVLNLFAQALEGGVYLHIAIAHGIGIISTVVVGFLLRRLGHEAEIKSATWGARRTWGTSRSRRTLEGIIGIVIKSETNSKC